MIDILEKYTKIAKLYQTDDLYDNYQGVIISASDLLTIIERLQQAEQTVALLVKEKFLQSFPTPKQDLGDLLADGYAAGKQVRKELRDSLRKKALK